MSTDLILSLIDAAAATIAANAEELTRLDQAIGDGDHGSNMQRGFQAILGQREALAAMPPGEALQKAGMTLVTTVGGASGPLYGSLLMAAGKAVQAGKSWPEACAEGVGAVKRRGKSDEGAKTMLDVLVPVVEALAAGRPLAELRAIATASREATKEMLATRGRASFLGERSRGHHDPGATSSQLLVHAICDVLERQA